MVSVLTSIRFEIFKYPLCFQITINNLSFALVFSKAVLNEGASPHPLEAELIYLIIHFCHESTY